MNLLKKNRGLLLRFDDIAPNMNWELMDKCEKLFLKYKIKPIVGVIPDNQDEELLSFPFRNNFWNKIKKWQTYGWEVAIHGYNHKYTADTKKKDFFNYGGKSEFFGFSLDSQVSKIKNSIKIFKMNNIKVRCFFAPNHTYDKNTFEALKINGINEIIDGYGLFPYDKFGIKFIPQLFYNTVLLPYGIQSTQIHLNNWGSKDFDKFKTFIEKNHNKIISYEQALSKTSNSFMNLILRYSIEYFLRCFRLLRSKF